MAFVNYNNKEITVKIVYYGPALSGKTTCLKYIYESGEYRKKGKLITLDTDGDRTLFFDFLPIEIGKLGDYSIKMQLYTVPGQVAYNTTRKLVLQGSDGIVFVADSQVVMREQNIDSFNNLKENLKANNIPFDETPLIFQFNKRDLRETLPVDLINKDLNPENKYFFPTIGTTGENILEALHTIMKMVIIHLKNKLSIFQKDKTVMFSRDEITDSVVKKNSPPPPPKRPEPEPIIVAKKVESFIASADTEKEEIFELSSPISEEILKTRNYQKIDEDIFNLGEESRMGIGDGDLDIPEVVLADELRGDERETRAMDLSELKQAEPEVRKKEKTGTIKEVEHEVEYELSPDIMVTDGITSSVSTPQFSRSTSLKGVDIPVHIEVPDDKDEITINLNLRIVIKRKP